MIPTTAESQESRDCLNTTKTLKQKRSSAVASVQMWQYQIPQMMLFLLYLRQSVCDTAIDELQLSVDTTILSHLYYSTLNWKRNWKVQYILSVDVLVGNRLKLQSSVYTYPRYMSTLIIESISFHHACKHKIRQHKINLGNILNNTSQIICMPCRFIAQLCSLLMPWNTVTVTLPKAVI